MLRYFLLLLVVAITTQASPNVLFILTDDLGINDLHCYGRADHKTPHLDRLAAEGIRFTSAYCAQPICSPSRAAILTGKTPARLHLTTYLPGRRDADSQKLLHPKMEQQLPLNVKTVGEYFRETGYATAWIGKWHLGGNGYLPTDQGFEIYHPGNATTKPSESEGGKGEFDLTARAEEFMERHKDKPFALFLSHNSPHIPYSARTNLIQQHAQAFDPTYAAVIETLDMTVGRLLAKVDALGLRTNTLVIFTSDNGGLHVPEGPHRRITHNTPFRAGKGFMYEGGLRIPLIVRWPTVVPVGKTIDTPVINTDWMPTLLALCGIHSSESFDGHDIGDVLRGVASQTEREFFWHFPHYTNQGGRPAGAHRNGDWKLIHFYEDGRSELYNLKKDPSESHDVANEEPRRTARMSEALTRWLKTINAQTNAPNPNFKTELHRPIYVDYDVSRYDPASASSSEFNRVLNWRKLMDTAVK